MGNLFVRAWKGEASLAAAFWLIYFVFGIILTIILIVIFSFLVTGFTFETHGDILMAIEFPYVLYAAICVWRCGKNSATIWMILSRIVVVLAVINGLFHIYHAFVPRERMPVEQSTTAQTTPAESTTTTSAPAETTTTQAP